MIATKKSIIFLLINLFITLASWSQGITEKDLHKSITDFIVPLIGEKLVNIRPLLLPAHTEFRPYRPFINGSDRRNNISLL